MLIIVLFVILAAAAIAGVFSNRYGSLEALLQGLTILLCLVLVVMGTAVALKPLVVEANLADYYAMKITVEDARNNNGLSVYEHAALTKEIIENNAVIMHHRAFYKSAWVGCFYSRKIADLPLILWGDEAAQ